MSRTYDLRYLQDLEPADLGISCFSKYRDIQLEAIEAIAYGEKRFSALSLPTGSGKSGAAFSVAKFTGLRTVILTSTLGLQSQYLRDFKQDGLVDVRGRSNYQCIDFADTTCLHGGVRGCRCMNGKGCEYERARDSARNADYIVTSYAYWLVANDHANGLERTAKEAEWKGDNPVELLICDEGDAGREHLENYLAVRIYESEIKRWVNPKEMNDDAESWRGLAEIAAGEIETELEAKKLVLKGKGRDSKHEEIEDVLKLERLQQKFERVRGIDSKEWVIEKRDGTRWGRMWAFDVVWPGRYAEQYLFCGVKKVVVMSATLRPKEMGLLGVGKEKFEFKEWDRVFPANRHQIYSVPARTKENTEVRIDRRTSEADMRIWVEHIDNIISGRLDRKGIIQTVSYDRQKFLMDNSIHSSLFLGNTADPDSDTAAEVAEEFKKSKAPRILVSPSFARGWDFPGEQCEYVIICKVPFKANNGKAAKARESKDVQYGSYLAMQEMVQGCGRGMRSAEDRCECFITDGHLTWFLNKNKGLAPAWFAGAVRRVVSIPDAPEKLRTEVKTTPIK